MDNFLNGAGLVDPKRGSSGGFVWISATDKSVRANSHYSKLLAQLHKKEEKAAKKSARKSGSRKVSRDSHSRHGQYIYNFGEDSVSSESSEEHSSTVEEEEDHHTSNSADNEDMMMAMMTGGSSNAPRNSYVPSTKGNKGKEKQATKVPESLQQYATTFKEKHYVAY